MQDNNNLGKISNKLRSNYRGSSLYLAIVVVLLVITLLGLTWFSYCSYISNKKFGTLLEQNSGNIQKTDNNLMQLRSLVDQNQNDIKGLRVSLDNILAFEKQPLLNVALLTFKNLVDTADLKLKLDKDISSAIAILKIADKYIASGSNLAKTDLANLKKDLDSKIEKLGQIKSIDLFAIIELLDAYAARIEGLKLADLLAGKNSTVTDVNSNSKDGTNLSNIDGWRAWIFKLRTDFGAFISGLIRIRNTNDSANNVSRLLDEGQIDLLKMYLKLQVTMVKINLLQHNYPLVVNNINSLVANTNLYFNDSLAIKSELMQLLEKIKNLNIQSESVDLDDLVIKINLLSNATPS